MPTHSSRYPFILIGPMGVGKTAVGRELAKQLRLEFIDTDAAIEAHTGVDIGFIFEKEGEAGFRQRETRMLEHLLQTPDAIIATGGGIVVTERNRKLLGRTGTVIHLTATLDTQLARTAASHHRPLLEQGDKRHKLHSLNVARAPLYAALADHKFATDASTAKAIARQIINTMDAL